MVGALVALLVATSGCDFGAVDEAAELLTEGGRKQLRDPVRPIRGAPRVLIFGVDGVGYESLRTAFRTGGFAEVSQRLGAGPDGPEVHSMTTVLPSITLAAWTSLFTGEPPALTGVPGNEWFDRATMEFRAPAPVSVSGNEDALATMADGAIGQWSPPPTLFERANVRAHVSLLPVHRGADFLTMPDAEDLADLFAGFVEGVVEDAPGEREMYAEVDQASVEEALNVLEDEGVPDLQVVYFPGVDLFTHAAGDPLASQQRYIAEVLDPAMARLIDAYVERGAWDDTWLVIVADHGHTPVPGDDHHALGASGGLTALLDTLGWTPRPPDLRTDETEFRSVVAYQGAFAYVYLADPTTCAREGEPCDWARPPRPADVERVAEAIRVQAAGRDSTQSGGSLEMILLPRRDAEGNLTRIDLWDRDGARDLASVQLTDTGPHFRLRERLGWLLDGPEGDHAGDIVLLARSGAWVPEDGRFYFSHPYRSWHGSPDPSDSRIGLVVERAGSGSGASVPADATQLDFLPLILRLLEIEDPSSTRSPSR